MLGLIISYLLILLLKIENVFNIGNYSFIMNWRENLDPVLQEVFEDLLKDVKKERKAYSSAKDVSKAQLWCAVLVLSKRISDLNLKIKSFEVDKKVNNKIKKSMGKL